MSAAHTEYSFQRFPVLAPFLTLLLTLFTCGLYVPYWLYTRTRLINTLCPQKPIPTFVVSLCMGGVLMVMMLLVQVIQTPEFSALANMQEQTNQEEMLEQLETLQKNLIKSTVFQYFLDAAMVINMMQFFWALLFCQRLNLCAKTQMGNPLYASYFMLLLSHLFIVNIFYCQYKINQLVENKITISLDKKDNIGLM